jgi:hypothetical protein
MLRLGTNLTEAYEQALDALEEKLNSPISRPGCAGRENVEANRNHRSIK